MNLNTEFPIKRSCCKTPFFRGCCKSARFEKPEERLGDWTCESVDDGSLMGDEEDGAFATAPKRSILKRAAVSTLLASKATSSAVASTLLASKATNPAAVSTNPPPPQPTNPPTQRAAQPTSQLTNDQLLERLKQLVQTERRVTTEILHHLLEMERRRLYAALGYASLFEYCTQGLKYTESAAYRRIATMRLLRDMPEMETPIQKGELNISTASQLQSFFIGVQRHEGRSLTLHEKRAIIDKAKGGSARDCEKLLAKLSPKAVSQDRERRLTENLTKITFVADDVLLQQLRTIRDRHAHKLHGKSDYATLFHAMADLILETHRQTHSHKKVAAQNSDKRTPPHPTKATHPTSTSLPTSEVKAKGINLTPPPLQKEKLTNHHNRTIPTSLRQEIWTRDQGQCTFEDPSTRRRCQSRYKLEIDHKIPFALGGDTTLENLRLCCRAHNAYLALQAFGPNHMRKYLSGL